MTLPAAVPCSGSSPFLLLLLLLLLAGAGRYWWYASPSAVLSGQVVASESHRQPVAGAEISVVGTTRSVRTDSQGRFLLKLLPAGAIQVKVAAPGYDDSDPHGADEPRRGNATRYRLGVKPSAVLAARGTATISGQVLDGESGQPLAGVQVSIQGSNAATVSTASDGRFQFAAFSENKAEVQAELPGYQKTTTSWVAGAKPLTIRLSGGASLKGNVVAEAYDRPTPISGASVRLIGSDSTTTTDRDGRFCLQSLVGGRNDVQVEISAEGYATRTVTTDLPDDGAVLTDVALAGAAVVNGSVADQLKGQADCRRRRSPAGNASQDTDGTRWEVRACRRSPRQPYPSRFPRRLSRRREIGDRHGQRQPADRPGAHRFEVFARHSRLGTRTQAGRLRYGTTPQPPSVLRRLP